MAKITVPGKIKFLAAVALLLVAIAFAAQVFRDRRDDQPAGPIPADPVKADTRIIAEGYVTPVKASGLNFAMPGLIAELLVTEGETVREGQALARLDDRELKAQHQQARAGLAKSQVNFDMIDSGSKLKEIEQKEAQAESLLATCALAETEFKRKSELFAQSAISQQEMEQAEAAYKKSAAELKAAAAALDAAAKLREETLATAKADLASARSSVDYYQSQLDRTELKAPFDGTVMLVNFNVGEYAVTGSTNVLDAGMTANTTVQLGDLSSWRVKTDNLTEMDITGVITGASAMVQFDAIPGLELPGRVAQVRSYGEKKYGDMTYTVTVDLEGNDPRLRWNMRAIVAIERGP